MTEEERRSRLLALGYDPNEYELVTPKEKAYEDMTGTGAFLTGAGQGVGGGIGGLGGAAMGAAYGSAFGPVGTLVGGITGGIFGGIAGGMGQSVAEDAFLDDAEEQALALKRQIALEKHPNLTLAGQFAPSLLAARPSFTTIRNLPKAFANAPTRSQTAMQRYALASAGFGGGLEAGIEAGSQALLDEEMDWSRVGTAGLLGGLATEPTRLFGKVGATAARKGETSKQFLERTGMLRPLTEVEAIAENAEVAARHQKSLREAAEKAEKDLAAADVEKTTKAEVKAEADEARRTEPTREEELDAERHIDRDVEEADTARMKAHGAWTKAKHELDNLPTELNDTPFVAKARRNVAELKTASDEASDLLIKAKEDRVRMREELAAKELEAKSLWERHSKRKAAIDGTEPKPAPEKLLAAAKGLAARLGITWHKAIPELHAMDNAGKRIDLRGKYNVREHSITLDSLQAEADTPFHEYLHGLWQALKRSPDRKHSGLIELFENELFKDSPRRQALKSSGERKMWSEERIVESTGKALTERMDNPPKGWTDKLRQWLDDWSLERDARKGFPVKEGELTDAHFKRIVDWMAMRGERQPALQPKQLELMLGDLSVKSPLMSGLTTPTTGGKKYADDLLTEEGVAAKEEEDIRGQAVEFDPDDKAWQAGEIRFRKEIALEPRNAKIPTLSKEDLAYVHPLMVHNLEYFDKHPELTMFSGLDPAEYPKHYEIGKPYDDHDKAYDMAKYASNLSVETYYKRQGIPFGGLEGIANTLESVLAVMKGGKGGLDSNALEKVYMVSLYRYARFLLKNRDHTPPWLRFQPVKPEEFAAAADVMAKHDPTLLKKYSKRVRGKMMDRIKKGTFSVARGQQILARFVNKPFPSEMSGEEIAQVINGLEMHHGSPKAESILREGFKGEELETDAVGLRGIFMTARKPVATGYATGYRGGRDHPEGGVIPIRTNFKKLFDLNAAPTQEEFMQFVDTFEKTAKDLYGDTPQNPLTSKEALEVKEEWKDQLRSKAGRYPHTYWSAFADMRKTRVLATRGEMVWQGFRKGEAVKLAYDREAEGFVDPNQGNEELQRGDFHSKVLQKMGYDGLTHLEGVRNVPHRVAVAFREPFEAATDQLHEYYGGERLQDVDTFLEDMNEYQLNTNTDHFASNPAAKRPLLLDSIVEQLRKTAYKGSAEEQRTASRVADAADATARDAQRLEGEFLEAFEFVELKRVRLSEDDGRHAAIYMAYMRRGMPESIPADTMARYNAPSSPVKHYVDFFYRNYTEVRDRQIKADMKIWHPKEGVLTEAGRDPAYVPEMINQDMWHILNGKEGAKARTDAKKELVDWWENNLDEPGSISREELEQAADQYIAKLSGGSAHLGSSKFGALRKAESIGLPLRLKEDGTFAWIDSHAGRAYQRYMRRFARDFAFYKNMESDSFVRQALGLMKQDRTYDAALPEGENPFHVPSKKDDDGVRVNTGMTADKNLKDFMKAYLGYYEGDELFGRTANRLVVSHWLGVMSGVRDLGSSYVFALPHLRGVDMPLILTSLKDFGRNWRQSHLLGVNKSHANRLEFSTETHNKIADGLNTYSDLVSKLSGRTPLERLTRAAQFGLGRAAVLQHIGLAQGASVTADRNLRRLGQMSGVDVQALRNHANKDLTDFKLPDEQFDDMLDRMAASWVDANQGTYDVRGVPAFTMSGPMATFTSLARWNIEKWNMTKKELVNPLVDEGDWRPFVKATLGAAFTGTLLIELSEFINNKFRADATLMEAVREADKEEMTYAIADSLNYAGYFGLGSALFNDTAVALMRGERPGTGGIVFPALDFVSQSLMEPVFDATTAIQEGAEPLSTVREALHDVLKGTMQTYRIMWNHSFLMDIGDGRKESDEKNIRRDLRIFRKFEGIRGTPPSPDMGNRYLRPDTRAFKEAETVRESAELLPAAFEEQRKRAKGRGDKLKSYTTGLYTIPDKTLPAVATPEGVEEFMRYKDYLTRQEGWFSARGDRYWRRIFNEWADSKQLTATKKALVKGYVQHLMERGARR